jgi:23S rRNA (guanosine2251-2'-O)-methyltransferase
VIDISTQQFKIEGRNAVIEAIRAGHDISKILVKKGERHGTIFEIIKMAKQAGICLQEIDGKAFENVAETRGHQGVIAIAAPVEYVSVEDILRQADIKNEDPLIYVLNEIEDPQNLGSILRTAECFGVHGVIIPKHRACGITSTVMKVSAGAVSHVNVSRVTNIASTLDELKQKGLWVMGADSQGQDCFKTDLTGPVALVIGGEDKGLGRLVRQKCDLLVRIPMRGCINSLNAAVAAAILGYEITRQRVNLT